MKKIVVVGPGSVGKTSLVWKLLMPGFRPTAHNPLPTLGVEVHPITLANGTRLEVWDTAGPAEHSGLRDGYYLASKGFVILLGPDKTQENFEWWYKDVSRFEAPVVAALNNGAQLESVPVGVRVCHLNIAQNENLEAPFLELCLDPSL